MTYILLSLAIIAILVLIVGAYLANDDHGWP